MRGMGGSEPHSGESMVAFIQQRRLCPCCLQATKTIAHVLFDCAKYQQQRTDLLTDLATIDDTMHAWLSPACIDLSSY